MVMGGVGRTGPYRIGPERRAGEIERACSHSSSAPHSVLLPVPIGLCAGRRIRDTPSAARTVRGPDPGEPRGGLNREIALPAPHAASGFSASCRRTAPQPKLGAGSDALVGVHGAGGDHRLVHRHLARARRYAPCRSPPFRARVRRGNRPTDPPGEIPRDHRPIPPSGSSWPRSWRRRRSFIGGFVAIGGVVTYRGLPRQQRTPRAPITANLPGIGLSLVRWRRNRPANPLRSLRAPLRPYRA